MLHDEGDQRAQPVALRERARKCARPRHHHRSRRDAERLLRRAGEEAFAGEVIQARRAGQGDPGRQDGALPHQHAVQEQTARPDEGVVLDDHWPRPGRFEDAAHDDARGQVNARADLRAGADQHVRVDHGVRADPGADVDVRRRHDNDARLEMRAGPDRGPPRHDAPRPAGPHRGPRVG